MSRTTVNYCGVQLECEYDYERGFAGSRIDPPYAASAQVSSVKVGGVECIDLFDDRQYAAIQALVLEAHGDEHEAAEADHWDSLRKERAMEERP
jgi:hypothetical protein